MADFNMQQCIMGKVRAGMSASEALAACKNEEGKSAKRAKKERITKQNRAKIEGAIRARRGRK